MSLVLQIIHTNIHVQGASSHFQSASALTSESPFLIDIPLCYILLSDGYFFHDQKHLI